MVVLPAPNLTASVLAVALRNNKSVFCGETGFAPVILRDVLRTTFLKGLVLQVYRQHKQRDPCPSLTLGKCIYAVAKLE